MVAEIPQFLCFEGGGAAAVDLSSDGRFLAFASDLSLVPEDTNNATDVYLFDRLKDAVELLSVAKDGSLGNANSASGFVLERLSVIALTPDARYAAFYSTASNLVPDDTNIWEDVFVADTSQPVGGVAVYLDPSEESSLNLAGESRRDYPLLAGIAAAATMGAVALASAAWYARRRWSKR